MSSTITICSGCKKILPKKEHIICATCKLGYDLLCANLSSKRFSSMDTNSKNKWNCFECRSKVPKCDNSNTPIRTTSRAVASDEECILEQEEDSNVTKRIKPQYSKSENSDSYVTEDKLRRIINQETTEIITRLVSEHLALILLLILLQ